MNYPVVTKIIETKKENPDVKTIYFENFEKIVPGQFFMIWIPGIDEIPMSSSFIDKNIKGITFRRVGDATKALFNFKNEQLIGIRGPYGNGFKISGKNILFVGGGTGIATIVPAVEQTVKKGYLATVILGVKNKNELFFKDRLEKIDAKVHVTTDDGSLGFKGFATDIVEKILDENKFDSIITCGPEIMMKRLLEMGRDIPFQASLERYMKCGFGLCGQCTIGDGIRVCKEGPVFDGKTLKNIEDFGLFKRDGAGRKVRF
jgi:dihydroorotate dehydrogenase electron transfer subunit